MTNVVRLNWVMALMLGMSCGVAQGDSIMDFVDSSSSSSAEATAPVQVAQVNPEKFVFERFGEVVFPGPGEAPPVYAEFIGVPAFESALRNRLAARGYKLSETKVPGVARLQLAADYSAEGKYQEVGKVRTGNVELGKVLTSSTMPPNKEAADSGKGPSALSGIGRDLSANYHSLQISGGSLVGSFGVQAVVAGLFDLTGLTGLIQRTHAPGGKDGQVVNVWLNYTSGDGSAQSSSRIEARYGEPILAPAQLAGAAFENALSGVGLGELHRDRKP